MALPSFNLDVDHVVDCLNTDGIYVSRGLLGGETVRRLNGEFDLLLTREFHGVTENKNLTSGRSFRMTYKKVDKGNFPSIMELFFCEELRSIAERYMPKGSIINNDLMATYDDKCPRFVKDHFDLLRALKFMIYLSDTDENNGAFCYSRGTQTENARIRRQHLRFGGNLKSLPTALEDGEIVSSQRIDGPAGTLIIFDTEAFHRAGSMADGTTRRILRNRCLFANQPAKTPIKYSRRWFWEHRLNPIKVFAPEAPAGRISQRVLRRAGEPL